MNTDNTYFNQHDYEVRCEWGAHGLTQLAPISDVIIIVDVLSFTTCVDIATANGATIFPYRGESAAQYAEERSALLAATHRQQTTGYSLAPSSLVNIPSGTRLVLPSPNGSTLSLMTDHPHIFAGCLRNAKAVAAAAQQVGQQIAVIPAGERWPDKTLRPSLEDQLGAGAIIHHLRGSKSTEAQAAETLFLHFRADLLATLRACGSGKELIGRGFAEDVDLAAALDVSTSAPLLHDGAYRSNASS